MRVLALDVDGVLLDVDRGGLGHWTVALEREMGITREELQRHFFEPFWSDVIRGRRLLRPNLGHALRTIGSPASTEAVLDCWFGADFVIVEPALACARRAAARGIAVALVTNQEPERARYLRDRLGALVPLRAVIASGDVGATKADPGFFAAATDRLGSAPGHIVFADDDDANVAAARAAGWTAIWADPRSTWVGVAEMELGLRRR